MKRLLNIMSQTQISINCCRQKELKLFHNFTSFQYRGFSICEQTEVPMKEKLDKLKSGPSLKDFISQTLPPESTSIKDELIPYLTENVDAVPNRKVYFDVYGCQMNVNDTEVVWSILKKNKYLKTDVLGEADIVLIMTCAIRDNAETKIWNRLKQLGALKRKRSKHKPKLVIGILGCMAERLKHNLLEKEKNVELVAGPDSYKDLPRLLAMTENNQTAINVILSLDETYADVMPIRLNTTSKSAFVTIMRGCDNMCTYCIVPFTRGKERSRPVDSILQEIQHISDQGIKEVTLLGQNVNSYRDLSESSEICNSTNMAKGFKTVYKIKKGGLRFADLLHQVSLVDPEMRIRFTSPHPKDFPDEVLEVIKDRPNICKSLHIPAQSGSSAVLERMRRGYTRETYLELIDHIRNILPGVTISTDLICGFCHETEDEFNETITLMERVKYNTAYLFAYSMREKTTAHRRYIDDVPEDVKIERVKKMNEIFRKYADETNRSLIGEIQLVLVEGISKKSNQMISGRNDGNTRVLVPNKDIPQACDNHRLQSISAGDYIAVRIDEANSQSLRGIPLFHTSLNSFHILMSKMKLLKEKTVGF